MKEKRVPLHHGLWSSRGAFIIAATGAAVGLGNIWKFPYVAGENGGGAFVIIYIFCALILGFPLMMAEILLGRYARQNPAGTIRTIAIEAKKNKFWSFVGALTILVGPLILSYYSVIAGWALGYSFKSISGIFDHIDAHKTTLLFQNFIDKPVKLIFWHSVIMLGSIIVIARGLEKAIEKTVRFMLPTLVALLIIIAIYGINTGSFDEAFVYLFKPDFSKVSGKTLLLAAGQAFFSLSIATGTIMMFGAYLPRYASVTSSAFIIVIADTLIALLAGLAIFPIVMKYHLPPDTGPGLAFQTLPIALGNLPYSSFFATLFFIMLVFAAFTSSISLLEPPVAWMTESKKLSRTKATVLVGGTVWLVGIGVALSFNRWSHFKLLNLNIFETLDFLTADIMLPLGGLLIAIFTGWQLPKSFLLQELQLKDNALFYAWRFTLRFVVPTTIVAFFLYLFIF